MEKPRPPDSVVDPAKDERSADTEGGEAWVLDQALELRKLISDRHARDVEEESP
jgi:hypothetical protein